jgi:hypothetical protein
VSIAYRVYEPHECGQDGYPFAWHETIKHEVREEAGHRCVRCLHPFVVGQSGTMDGPCAETKAFAAELGVNVELFDAAMEEYADVALDALPKARRTNWSPCDSACIHEGPVRVGAEGVWREHAELSAGFHAGDLVSLHAPLHVEAAWRILTVHHLNERKPDCRWWNLAALCQRCHLYVQRKVLMERVYPWEHSDWFKPYAAGWYAYAYLGEELSRADVAARLDELLALERVA